MSDLKHIGAQGARCPNYTTVLVVLHQSPSDSQAMSAICFSSVVLSSWSRLSAWRSVEGSLCQHKWRYISVSEARIGP